MPLCRTIIMPRLRLANYEQAVAKKNLRIVNSASVSDMRARLDALGVETTATFVQVWREAHT